MRKLNLIVIFLIAAVSLTAWCRDGEGGETGNGTDEMRILFKKARHSAAEKVQALNSCSFTPDTSIEVRRWILSNKRALAEDILSSPHRWVTDDQATCAWTQTDAASEITLSFVKCSVADEATAGEVLTHESVHHFNIPDENFADDVARAVYSSTLSKNCPATDPFDPNSCEGDRMSNEDAKLLLEPGSDFSSLSNYYFHKRERTCNGATCTDWYRQTVATLELFSKGTDYPVRQLFSGIGPLDLRMREGQVYFQFAQIGLASYCLVASEDACLLRGEGNTPLYDKNPRSNALQPLRFIGKMTNQCLRYAAKTSHRDPSSGQWLEREYVVFSYF